jgi:hypothetical protein
MVATMSRRRDATVISTKWTDFDALPKHLLSVVRPVGQVLRAKTFYQQNDNNDALSLKHGWTKCSNADVTCVTGRSGIQIQVGAHIAGPCHVGDSGRLII